MQDNVTQVDCEADLAFISALAECAIAHGQIMLQAETAADMLKAAQRQANRSRGYFDTLFAFVERQVGEAIRR